MAGDGEADGDDGHDEDGEDGSGKAEAEDDEQKSGEDEEDQRVVIVGEDEQGGDGGDGEKRRVLPSCEGCRMAKKPGRWRMKTSGARMAMPRMSPRYQVRKSCHQGPAGTKRRVQEAPRALAMAVAPMTATPRKATRGRRLERLNGLAEPVREEQGRGDDFDGVGESDADGEVEGIAPEDVGERVGEKADEEVAEPDLPGTQDDDGEQHSVGEPDGRHALGLAGERDAEVGEEQQNQERWRGACPRSRTRGVEILRRPWRFRRAPRIRGQTCGDNRFLWKMQLYRGGSEGTMQNASRGFGRDDDFCGGSKRRVFVVGRRERTTAETRVTARLGGEDVGVDVLVAELALGVLVLEEGLVVRHLGVEMLESRGLHGEEFGPVGAGVEGGEFFFDQREDFFDFGPLGLPGEVDGQGGALVGHADPEVVGGDGAEFSDEEVRGDVVAELLDGEDGLVGAGRGGRSTRFAARLRCWG